MNSEYLLGQLERSLARLDRTPLRKSMAYTGNTRRRSAPDFGKPEQPVDLLKAQRALDNLHRSGQLTDEQAGKAQAKLMSLRPTQVITWK
jgi:hypothetical protein